MDLRPKHSYGNDRILRHGTSSLCRLKILQNGSRTVVCRQLHVIHVPFTDHLISSHLSPAIYPIFRCCQTSGTSDLPDFSLLPDVCHQRFIRLFAAARRLAAATPFIFFGFGGRISANTTGNFDKICTHLHIHNHVRCI